MYSDAQQTLALKEYVSFTQHAPRERETCVLQALQQFFWAPRWFCTGTDYVSSSYSGRAACREHAPHDYIAQIGGMLSDLHSVGVRHNHLCKQGRTDLVVDERTGRMSLTDYGWASINGSLGMTCATHGGRLLVATQSRPRSSELDEGLVRPEIPELVTMPSCLGLYAANRTQMDKAFTVTGGCKTLLQAMHPTSSARVLNQALPDQQNHTEDRPERRRPRPLDDAEMLVRDRCDVRAAHPVRVAVAFYGLIRNIMFTLPSLRTNLLAPLRDAVGAVDVFVHTMLVRALARDADATELSSHSGADHQEVGVALHLLDFARLEPCRFAVEDQDEIDQVRTKWASNRCPMLPRAL